MLSGNGHNRDKGEGNGNEVKGKGERDGNEGNAMNKGMGKGRGKADMGKEGTYKSRGKDGRVHITYLPDDEVDECVTKGRAKGKDGSEDNERECPSQ